MKIEARILGIIKIMNRVTRVLVSVYKDGVHYRDYEFIYEGVDYTKEEIKRLIYEDLEAIFNTSVRECPA